MLLSQSPGIQWL